MRDAPGTDQPGPDNVIVLPGVGANPPRLDAWDVRVDDPPPDDGEETFELEAELAPPAPQLLEGAVEALLLASSDPLSEADLDRFLAGPGKDAVRNALVDIQERYRRGPGGIRLVQVAKGWQLRTDVRFARWVAVMRGGKPMRLSRAALETLAMVAYRQPVTRAEVEDLRGVDSGGVIRVLCERGLLMVAGRKDVPGRPLVYGTTPRFLEMFGLRDLSELPTLRDLRELQADDPRESVVSLGNDEPLDDLDELGDDDLATAPPGADLPEGELGHEPPPRPRPAPPRRQVQELLPFGPPTPEQAP